MKKVNDRKYIVLGTEHYNPLGVIRSLGKSGISPIAIIKKSKYGLASKSKYISKLYLVESNEEALKFLLDNFNNEVNKPFIFTCDDQLTSMLDNNYELLRKKYIFFNAGENGKITKYMNKSEIMSLAEKCGLKVAKSWKVQNKTIPTDIKYPVLTKAIISTKDNWKSDSYICSNEIELKEALNKIKSPEILIQEYIKKKNELCYDGYSYNEGKNVFYSISTNYLYIKEGAYSSYMLVSSPHHKELEDNMDKMFKEIGFEGIFSVEFLVDSNDNYYFLEINFRNSTWSWASTVAGMNLPLLWSNSMINNVVEPPYKKIRPFKAIVELYDLNDRVKTKQISLIKWIYQVITAKARYFWYFKDPMPILSKFIRKINKKYY